MELNEDKMSFASIKQYLLYLKAGMGNGLDELEFKTIKGWLFYSLLLMMIVSAPCVFVLLVTGCFWEITPIDLLIYISIIPLMFVLPAILLYTFFCNYRKPKQKRKQLLQFLNRYDWDEPIQQISQCGFDCMKGNCIFRAEIRKLLDEKDQEKCFFTIFVPFHLPVSSEEEEDYLGRIDTYLDGKSQFFLHSDEAYLSAPVKMYPKLDIHKDIEQLLYIMNRFRLHPTTFYSRCDILKKVPDSSEILAMSIFGHHVDQKCLDWATNMVEAGFVNKNMKNFQQQTLLPDNQIELKEQLKNIIIEFDMKTFTDNDVVNSYVNYLLLKEQQGERSPLQIIQSLNDLYLSSKSPELQSFNVLYESKVTLDQTGKQDCPTEARLSDDKAGSDILFYLNMWVMMNN